MQTIEQLRAGKLNGVKYLKLSCGLNSFPEEVFSLQDSLEILDLSGNALCELPESLTQLKKLRILFCSNNAFTELPEVLGRCSDLSMIGFKANRIRKVSDGALPAKLRWLILTDNEITELPRTIGKCSQLQKLMLAGNSLHSLPETLASCRQLELIRIAANKLTELPSWLLSLPRLSWLAFSGNPLGADLENQRLKSSTIEDIPWHTLTVNHLLGEGASGFIHRADYQKANAMAKQVAVKLFKGAVTSDGLPQSEMAAALAAGQHPNLINVLGKITDHPEEKQGLMMELIGSEFKNLADPPSFASCTRDVYSAETRFNLAIVLRIALGIASVCLHLHTLGIMHGDLYGHNILHCEQGRALIGDFGAASFFDSTKQHLADKLQQVEVRAYGCLLEELIERCHASANDAHILSLISELTSACLADDYERRPSFKEITMRLNKLIKQ